MPRKKSEEFYRLYGFKANYGQGKYTATCNFCERELQNTALSRLSLHRQTCNQRRSKCANDVEKDLEDRHHIKIQQISGEDDDGCDAEGKEIIVKIQQILDAADDDKSATKTRKPVLVKSETRPSDNPDQGTEHHMEFQISSADFVDESKEVSLQNYILQQQLEDSANGSGTLAEARPRNHLAALKAEKTRAEIKQYRSKTQFLKTETENLKLERTLTLLRIQKLRLEIDALRA